MAFDWQAISHAVQSVLVNVRTGRSGQWPVVVILVGVDSVEIKYPSKQHESRYVQVFPSGRHATSVVETVGMFLFALYHVSTIIVLINMLIAMMSHSFEAIQVGSVSVCLSVCVDCSLALSASLCVSLSLCVCCC